MNMQFSTKPPADARPAHRSDNATGFGGRATRRPALVCRWSLTGAGRLECRWQAEAETIALQPAIETHEVPARLAATGGSATSIVVARSLISLRVTELAHIAATGSKPGVAGGANRLPW